jgi:hypothetical protein
VKGSKRSKFCRVLLFMSLVIFCITGSLAQDPAIANREAINRVLRNLSLRAQRYVFTMLLDNGGQGSFSSLSLAQIATDYDNAYGHFVLTSPASGSVTLTGTGVEVGYDGSNPIEIQFVVYADSVTVTITN